MNRYIIVKGLPYLYANGKAYKCSLDERGFTLGAEVKIAEAPEAVYCEKSIRAKLTRLDSINDTENIQSDTKKIKKEPKARATEKVNKK